LARVYGPFGWALFCLVCCGCGRPLYRAWADRDVYGIEGERMFDWRWKLPGRPVEADPRSRMRDPSDPDREPIPPDDPAARRFQVSAGRHFEYHGWEKRGAAPIEDLSWLKYLPREPDGSVKIARDSVMRLAVVNSREYQVEVEDVYLAALSLTLSRFEFATQFFGTQRTFFDHFGTGKNETNQLQLTGRGGFNKRFLSGAQLLVDFANTLVFEFSGTGAGTNLSTSSLLVSVTQPLLRGAFARIVTQPLSLQERGVLYAVRDFARFRRGFYVDVIAGDGFLGLLTQLQTIRNTESNLKSLRRNLDEYQALAAAGLVSLLERDQIDQSYQSTQLELVQAQASLQSSLDNYKIRLGFPPDLELRLDDSVLNIFELNDPRLDALRTRNEALYLSLLQYTDPPSRKVMAEAGRTLRAELAELEPIAAGVADELRRWRADLGGDGGRTPGGTASPDRSETLDRQRTLSKGLGTVLADASAQITDNLQTIDTFLAGLDVADPEDATLEMRNLRAIGDFQAIRDLVGKEFRARFSEIFISQTQVRVFLIELAPAGVDPKGAIAIALGNRQDLMNAQGRVTDAWREIEVAANALRGFLNLRYEGNLGTDPERDGIFRFDTSNSRHRVGVEFDAPLNRLAERNAYRAEQVAYQRARRQYMATHDQILREIRLDLRQLDLSRRQFEIGRESLITASRQVEQAEYDLRTSTAEIPVTLNLLRALDSQLGAKNNLIGSWVQYETARMALYRDFDIMDINAEGVWTNEHDGTPIAGGVTPITGPLALPDGPRDPAARP